jgi:hypothetical protein
MRSAAPARESPPVPAARHVESRDGARLRVRIGAAAALLGLSVLAALLLVVPGTLNGTDGRSMLQVTSSIVERDDVTVSPSYGVRGLHGRWYSKYGPGQSLAAVPLYLAGRALAPLLPPYYRPEAPSMAASLLPTLATALTVTLLVLAATELGASARGALALGLVYAVATPAAIYALQWFSEPLTAVAVLAAFYLLVRERAYPTTWRALLAGAALAVAVATRLEALLFAPPLVLYALLPAGRRSARATAMLLPLGAVLVALGVYDAARFGSPLETGYGKGDAFAVRDIHPSPSPASIAAGVYGLLLSPGKGLLAYAPPALLAPVGDAALWTRRRAETVLLLALILIGLIAHANVLIRWVGGWSWGPRFLMPVLPLILLLLAPLLGPDRRHGRLVRRMLAALAVVGVLVQAPALVLDEPHTYLYALKARYHVPIYASVATMTRLEWQYVNRPELSPILGSWLLLGHSGTWTPHPDVAPALVARKSVTVAPHTWWRLLALQGIPTEPLVLACILLAMVAGGSMLAALRLTRPGRHYRSACCDREIPA